jgi:serine/threonine-protein kinase 11
MIKGLNFALSDFTPNSLEPSTTRKCINQYLKLGGIGRGGYGKVFAARDRQSQQLFAMKQIQLRLLARTRLGIAQLENEIALLTEFDHPNIIKLREVLHIPNHDTVYLVMDLADCGSLESILKSQPIPQIAVRYVFKELANALAYLHGRKMLHHDIKPGNILLSQDGRVRLTDFGLSHRFDAPSPVFGTPLYQAPEVLDLKAEPTASIGREDVWSLGVTLYEMLAGETPFKGRDIYEIFAAVRETELARPQNADDLVWELIGKMLAPDPAQRWTIAEVLQSEYVRGAPGSLMFEGLKMVAFADGDAEVPVVEETAVSCPPGYRFALATKGMAARGRISSDPGGL